MRPPPRPPAAAPDARGGFTLVELLVVLTLSAILLLLGMRAFAWQQQSVLSLRSQAHVGTELRLAAEWLLSDLGAAASVTAAGSDIVLIEREQKMAELLGTWSGGADAGLRYFLHDGYLVRRDLSTGIALPVAVMDAFDVTEEDDGLHMTLALGSGLQFRTLSFVWPD